MSEEQMTEYTRPPVEGEEGYGMYKYLAEQEREANLIAAKDHLYDFCKDRRERLTAIRGMIEKNIRCEDHKFSVNDIRLLDVILGWTA